MKGKLYSISVTGVLLALVSTFLCGSSARAQSDAKGEFVLPFEVQWQGKTLPAGEYHFVFRSNRASSVGDILILRDAQDHRNIMMVQPLAKDDLKGRDALTVVNRNGKRYVYSLAFEPIGATLVYSVPTRKRAAERALDASVQIIPVQRVGS